MLEAILVEIPRHLGVNPPVLRASHRVQQKAELGVQRVHGAKNWNGVFVQQVHLPHDLEKLAPLPEAPIEELQRLLERSTLIERSFHAHCTFIHPTLIAGSLNAH